MIKCRISIDVVLHCFSRNQWAVGGIRCSHQVAYLQPLLEYAGASMIFSFPLVSVHLFLISATLSSMERLHVVLCRTIVAGSPVSVPNPLGHGFVCSFLRDNCVGSLPGLFSGSRCSKVICRTDVLVSSLSSNYKCSCCMQCCRTVWNHSGLLARI